MKAIEVKRDVETSGDLDQNQFSIDVTSDVFNHLSSTLYTNKVLAVVREYSTNAWDSHVEARNNNPFDVHLPTIFNPTFSIRDYGTGLSLEDCRTVYTTYFRSTKTHSNDFNGKFGLGSKSFFSIADNYTVTSYYKGKKYVFSAYKDDKDMPQFVFHGEEDTEERNGIEVSGSVKKQDVTKFKNAAYSIYKIFPVTPNINLSEVSERIKSFKESKKEYNDIWTSDSELESYNFGKTEIIMGNVAYKTDIVHSLPYALYVNIPNGSASFDLGRENLVINEDLKNQIIDKINDYIKHILKETQDRINECEYEHDARKIIFSDAFSLRNYKLITFNGKMVNPKITIDLVGKDQDNAVRIEKKHRGGLHFSYYFQIKHDTILYKKPDGKLPIGKIKYNIKKFNISLTAISEEFAKKIGINPDSLVSMDTLEEKPKVEREKKLTVLCYRVTKDEFSESDREIPQGSVYCTMHRDCLDSSFSSLNNIKSALKELDEEGYDLKEVYVIRRRIESLKRFEKLGCRKLDSHLKEILKNRKVIVVRDDLDRYWNKRDYDELSPLLPKHEIIKWLNKKDSVIDKFSNKDSKKLSELQKQLENEFPLLKVCDVGKLVRNPKIAKEVLK